MTDPDYVSTTVRGMEGGGVSLGEVGGAEEWKPIISCPSNSMSIVNIKVKKIISILKVCVVE